MSTAGHLWMCLGGTEIFNQCLTTTLQGNGHGLAGVSCMDCDSCCEDLNRALGYGANGGSIGQAPWFDSTDPRSVEFAGLLVTSVTGLTPGEFSRPVTEAASVGALLGQGRSIAPQIVVTGILMGSCCGVDYGYQWLRSALKGSCGSGRQCKGDTLQFLACPPTFPDEDCQEEPVDYEFLLGDFIRSFKNAALVAGPTTQTIPRGCPTCHDCPMVEVTFTLASADPCVYREPLILVDQLVFDCDLPENDECIEWLPNAGSLCVVCATAQNCATDPDCQDISPPQMPSLMSVCVSNCLSIEHCRAFFDVPAGTFPTNGEGTLILELFSGDTAMRGITVLGWENSTGLTVDQLSDCDACFELNIGYVGANSTLVIDGTERSALIACENGNAARANPSIAGAGRSPVFQYPVLEGCSAYTVMITIDAPVSTQATLRVTSVGREC